MKKIFILTVAALFLAFCGAWGRDLVILHTNDTHSLILPDANGKGGVLQRKAIIDSVRHANKDVILIDAGDAVQGTLYFKFFRGDVEYPLQDMLGVDINILGNHEFDNGLDELARHYRGLKSSKISSNYDFSDTPARGIFDPYVIKKVGGKKIGFIGLNVDPASLIIADNYKGLKFNDVIQTANETAAFLKDKKKCDLVVAVTHIGYVKSNDKTTDPELAAASKDIDIIIGGHSHTLIDPAHPDKFPSIVENAEGRPVLIVQTGKSGKYIGQIRVDLDNLKSETPADFDYSLIEVTDRFPESRLDKKIMDFLAPFTARIDSVNSRVVAYADQDLVHERTGAFPNWTGDFGSWYGRHVLDSLRREDQSVPDLDFAIMNVGGIRSSWAKGPVTEGQVLNTFPFSNRVVIMEISGKDIIETLGVAARKGGEAISQEVKVLTDADGNLVRVIIDNEEMDPDKTYVVATIDYIAWGNDDMVSMANGKWIFRDDKEMSAPMLRYVSDFGRLGLPITSDPTPRFLPAAE